MILRKIEIKENVIHKELCNVFNNFQDETGYNLTLINNGLDINPFSSELEFTVTNNSKNLMVVITYHYERKFVNIYEYLQDANNQHIADTEYSIMVKNIKNSKRIITSFNSIL